MKTCTVCGTTPPVDPYDGVPNRCRSCHCAEMKRLRREAPDKFSARERARYVGARREKILASGKARRAIPGPKRDAQTAVGHAVRDGRLLKPSACSKCGRSGVRLEGHHDDYSRPLDVVWLCCRCHRRHHADNPALPA